jgi:hypothetical protein
VDRQDFKQMVIDLMLGELGENANAPTRRWSIRP